MSELTPSNFFATIKFFEIFPNMFSVTTLFVSHSSLPSPLPLHMAKMRKLITVAVCVHYRGTNKVVVTISFTVLVIFSISSLHFEKNSRWFIKTSPRQTRYSYRTFSTGTCDDKFYCNRKIRMQKMAENLKLKLFYLNLSFFSQNYYTTGPGTAKSHSKLNKKSKC